MRNAIKNIIDEVPKDCIFDTHAIIEYLIQNNSDLYLSNYKGTSTEKYHGFIGQMIDEFEGKNLNLIERIGDSWSLNIHKKFSKCACWKKL